MSSEVKDSGYKSVSRESLSIPLTVTLPPLSVVYFKQDDLWVAQCLEVDITAQGKTKRQAKKNLLTQVNGEVALSVDLYSDFFRTILSKRIHQAPLFYWRLK